MIIDAKIDYKNWKLLLLHEDGSVDEYPTKRPYFYVITPKHRVNAIVNLIRSEEYDIEETDYTPIIDVGDRYAPSSDYKVLKVIGRDPKDIPLFADKLISYGLRCSGFNIRYIIRNCFDYNVRFLKSIPLYYGFDAKLIDRISNIELLIIDVEAIGKTPIIASIYKHRLLSEVEKDNIRTYELPKEQDELYKELLKSTIIAGHNVLGFDLPSLANIGMSIDKNSKLILDTSVILATHGYSLKVGSARSLLEVSKILKEDAKITDEELDIKAKAKGRVDRLSREDLVKYNRNDVVLTAKLLNVIAPFVFILSALTQIPVSEVIQIKVGMLAEYFLFHYCELLGYIPEYKHVVSKLEASRVETPRVKVLYRDVVQTDIKMTYPSFVLKFNVDPTLHIGNGEFNRKTGIGVLYSAVKRLYIIRELTKKLKKQDPRYESVDHGIKALINALAYGTQGKKTGYAIMGNPYCPSKIFYGTTEIQKTTIQELIQAGFKVVYSDTDSFFILKENHSVDEIVKKVNEILSRFGLEADVEGVWNEMYIYSKKCYVLRQGDKIVIKGSALKNLTKYYLPSCIDLAKIITLNDTNERKKYIKEVIESATIEDLFAHVAQQFYRLIGKSIDSVKRELKKGKFYLRVLTPWETPRILYLKKCHAGHFTKEDHAVLVKLFIDCNGNIHVEEFEPYVVYETLCLKPRHIVDKFRQYCGNFKILIYSDNIYAVNIDKVWYCIRYGNEEKYIPSDYGNVLKSGKGINPFGELTKVVAKIKVKKVNIPEDVLKNLVRIEVEKQLLEYGLL